MRRRRPLLHLARLCFITLDFSLPEMPGAFVFDTGDPVESIQAGRGRAAIEAVVLPVTSGRAVVLPGLPELRDHRLPTPPVAQREHHTVRRLTRPSADPTSPSEDSH